MFKIKSVFNSLMETALEENRRLNAERVEAVFRKAYALSRHPLLLAISSSSDQAPAAQAATAAGSAVVASQKLIDVGTKMVVARLGTSLVMELMRLIETMRARIAQGAAGGLGAGAVDPTSWGGAGLLPGGISANDPQYVSFLTTVQATFMKEYTAGSMKRKYSS
jgi:hypothetical protein